MVGRRERRGMRESGMRGGGEGEREEGKREGERWGEGGRGQQTGHCRLG